MGSRGDRVLAPADLPGTLPPGANAPGSCSPNSVQLFPPESPDTRIKRQSPRTSLGNQGGANGPPPCARSQGSQQVPAVPAAVDRPGRARLSALPLGCRQLSFLLSKALGATSPKARAQAATREHGFPAPRLAQRRGSRSPRVSGPGSRQLLPITSKAQSVSRQAGRRQADVPSGAPGSFQYNKPHSYNYVLS